jgi:hypothetical protein
MGRGFDHFRAEGAKLVPEPVTPDDYIDEAYRLWHLQQSGGQLELGPTKPQPAAGESQQLELASDYPNRPRQQLDVE